MALSLWGVLQTDIDKAARKKEEGIFVLDFQVPHDTRALVLLSIHSVTLNIVIQQQYNVRLTGHKEG